MQSDKLLEIIKSLKLEILDILLNSDLSNDRTAQVTILKIDDLFNRLNLAVDEVIPEDSLRSYYKGVDEATRALSQAGVIPLNGLQASISSDGIVRTAFATRMHYNAIAEITDNTMLDLKAAIRTAQQNTLHTVQTTLAKVKGEMQRGVIRGDNRREITKRVANAFAENGMTSFITSDGKKLPLDFYSEVVTRTNLKDANIKGSSNRYLENGVGLVQIFERDDGCSECAKYNGMVVSLTGEHEGFPTTDEVELPPRHPNCRGSISPFVLTHTSEKEISEAKERWANFDPEKDTRTKEQKEAYDEQQRLNRINNYEKKRYADIKGLLGDDAPKTLGAFKRMKRANTDNYKRLIQDYQDALKTIKYEEVFS